MINSTGQTQFYQVLGFNYGWICPKCGSVYAPTQTECYRCAPATECTITSTDTAKMDYIKWKETQSYYGKHSE